MLTKLSKMNYGKFFGSDFKTSQIDKDFEGIQNSDKAKIITNVIDLMFYSKQELS